MPSKKQPPIQQTAIGDGNVQVAGDNNTVRQEVTNYIPAENELKDVNHNEIQMTASAAPSQNAIGNYNIQVKGDRNFIQQIINFFRLDTEQMREMRNRRVMLGNVESFWVKGILEKSLYDMALLELGIKEDPDALNYPWAIKREAAKETLPSGMSMLEIFQEIGMGRSLLILGAPGSGKTTMLLELTRQLIERVRKDVTEPIPVVFNLSSWTEKLTLADWLARELNIIYYVPKKAAPTWVKENRMLLLLDGLDEVRQESRDKCVDAINQFRKENGLTSLAVCSRRQDYTDLKARLSFDGAIEIQPLTSNQVNEYFKHLGKELAGIRQTLKKDPVLREMAETPLFLSIMTLAFRNTPNKDILLSENLETQHKQLFNTYTERMFERLTRSAHLSYSKQQTLHYMYWLAWMQVSHNIATYLVESIQVDWLENKSQRLYRITVSVITGLIAWLSIGLIIGVISLLGGATDQKVIATALWFSGAMGLQGGVLTGLVFGSSDEIATIDRLKWSWEFGGTGLLLGLIFGLPAWLITGVSIGLKVGVVAGLLGGLIVALNVGVGLGIIAGFAGGLSSEKIEKTADPNHRLKQTLYNAFFLIIIIGLGGGVLGGLLFGLTLGQSLGLIRSLCFGLIGWLGVGLMFGLYYGVATLIQHYILRLFLIKQNLLPWRLIPFLDYCVDLIFLRRVGGGYIFVHRLLMEHFAAMYQEE